MTDCSKSISQNPEFGYYFLRLSTERLLQNIARLEGSIAQGEVKPQADTAKDTQ